MAGNTKMKRNLKPLKPLGKMPSEVNMLPNMDDKSERKGSRHLEPISQTPKYTFEQFNRWETTNSVDFVHPEQMVRKSHLPVLQKRQHVKTITGDQWETESHNSSEITQKLLQQLRIKYGTKDNINKKKKKYKLKSLADLGST